MYQNLASQNPLVNQFNGYMVQNPNMIPFQNNQLINNNPHVINNLNDLIQQHKLLQQNIPIYQQQYQNQQMSQMNQIPQINHIPQMNQQTQINKLTQTNQKLLTTKTNNKMKYGNIIEEMLKPQKIVKDNKDVDSNYKVRKEIQKNSKKGKINIKMTNAPYKTIIKDKIINKKVEDVKQEDLLVHKSIREIDANREKFDKELEIKKQEKEQINDELKIEFHIDNYDKHKKKFEYKETFIRNLAYEENTFDENKQDVIEFYRKQQKEAEEGQKLCDQILHNLVDEGVISKDELPVETNDINSTSELDLKSIINNIQTDEETNINSVKKTENIQNSLDKNLLTLSKNNNQKIINKPINKKPIKTFRNNKTNKLSITQKKK